MGYIKGKKRRGKTKKRGPPLSKKQVSGVNRLIHRNQELKYLDTLLSAVTVGGATAASRNVAYTITVPSQGTQDIQRIGDTIRLSDYLEGTLTVKQLEDAKSNNAEQWFRCIIVQNKQERDGTFGGADMLALPGDLLASGPSGNPDPYSLIRHDARQLFRVVYDKLIRTVSNGGAGLAYNTGMSATIKFKIPLWGDKVSKTLQYSAASTYVANHHLHMILMSTADAATEVHSVDGMVRFHFRDG